ncbi:MAG TPA: PAS domain S-box protein [Verrucomicrobiae bacterium]|nr:PAS domain S-box protein [Verrucomicrobiae bacterium]
MTVEQVEHKRLDLKELNDSGSPNGSAQQMLGSKIARDARLFLAAIVESSDDAIITKNLDGIITSWNKSAERTFGYTAEEAIGRPITLLIPEDRQDEEPNILARLRRGERVDHFETIRRRKDGVLLNISLTISPVKDESGNIIGASKVARDITHRKRAEEALRESEQRFRSLVDHSFVPIWVKDCDGRYMMANKRYEEVFGVSEEDITGKTDYDFHPGHVAKELRENDLQVIRTGKPMEAEETTYRKGVPRTFLSVKFPMRKVDGTIYAVAGLATDISERKQAEKILRQAKEQLGRANEALEQRVQERTASLREVIGQMEEFSYSVSHDLRAPVRAMKGYAMALLEDYNNKLDERGRELLARIVRSGARMEGLIHDVLTYSRLARAEIKLAPVSLQKLLPEIIEHYPAMQEPNAQITIREPLHPVLAHEPSLTQAISNLLSNAVKFVAPGVKPVVQVWTESVDGKVRLWFKDNGIGIKPAYHHRLFGMFERVHQDLHYEGTGIGLAIVRKAVEKMGGRAGVESDGISGSSFWIELSPGEEYSQNPA